ncbi:MAG: cob(I)yrinic acid a,c-diamide adenosyltransferase [Bacteroidetes bacterium]|nr:cob(I)yrinic acid a,c-diamide adenosyltransferase [Bacteroidota bacterium]
MSQDWKIYTKTGDSGTTSLIGGSRVPKDDLRIECYGTVDELVSWIGLLRDQAIDAKYTSILIEIQDRLFTIESLLAHDGNPLRNPLPTIVEEDILYLEKGIDDMNEELPELSSFILSGGHVIVSYCHIARTVCRRAERLVIRLDREQKVDPLNIKYLNRLSDYLFVLSRRLSHDLGATETLWRPRI